VGASGYRKLFCTLGSEISIPFTHIQCPKISHLHGKTTIRVIRRENPSFITVKHFFVSLRHTQGVLSYGILAYTEFVTKHKQLIVSGSMKQKAAKRLRTDKRRHTFVQEMKTDFPLN